MKVDLNEEPKLRSETVKLPEGDFHVHVKPPTYAELIHDLGQYENFQERRIKTVIVGWTGLTRDVPQDDGSSVEEEIPFTFDNLQKLCAKYPAALIQINLIAGNAFRGTDVDAAKNVRTASALFSADAVIRQMGLQPGSSTGGSVVLQNPQDSQPAS